MPDEIVLDGPWRVLVGDEHRRRLAVDPAIDDSGWPIAPTGRDGAPGHWCRIPGAETSGGPAVYRTDVVADPPAAGRRRWIVTDGVLYQADVYLDGAYLGDLEGTFSRGAFEITELSALDEHHVVAIEVSCPAVEGVRRTITGTYQPPSGPNPGGLPGPVRIVDTGPVRIDRFSVLCRDADESRAHLLLSARLDARRSRIVRLRTLVDDIVVAESEHDLASGTNDIRWALDIAEPRLWWPRVLGDQTLVSVAIEVVADGEVSDRAVRRTGLRQIAWDRWVCTVNGERLFVKSADLLPARYDIGHASYDELYADVDLAAEIGLDALHLVAHVAPDAVYDRADHHGLLILQDFPLVGTHARSVRARAVAQAADMVERLGHHPSVALWWAHGETLDAAPRRLIRRLVGRQRPSWNRAVLDTWVGRAIETADPTREVVARAGTTVDFPIPEVTDSHLWFGWRDGDLTDLDRAARRFPNLVRFVSAFGAPATGPDGDTRRQAEVVRHHVETLRRLKYQPTGGFSVAWLADPRPIDDVPPDESVSFGLLDGGRRPRPALTALREACAPVIVVGDLLVERCRPGDRLSTRVHVVSDLRHRIDGAVLRARLHRLGAPPIAEWSFGGAVDADSCAYVATIEFEVPEMSGPLELELVIDAEGHLGRRLLRTTVVG